MESARSIARRLAAGFVEGPWGAEGLAETARRIAGPRRKWPKLLAQSLLVAFGPSLRPRQTEVERHIIEDPGFLRAWKRGACGGLDPLDPRPVMFAARGAAESWLVPALVTPGGLERWLGLEPGKLRWFAGFPWRRTRPPGPLCHYRRSWLVGRTGKARLIESPKRKLCEIQKRILREILDKVPPHEAAHGFRKGRSVVTYSAPHAAKRVVLRLDLRGFFPSISVGRVAAVFRTVGYPERVALLLAGLTCTRTPEAIWSEAPLPARSAEGRSDFLRLCRRAHLPQGAPTSPALANLCALPIDRRLDALARAAGAQYTRYADDLAFSGGTDFDRSVGRFQLHAAAIAMEEGFSVNFRKTRVLRRGIRQRIAGVVVNAHPNVPREDFDVLKATLHNCVRRGPRAENRSAIPDFRAHLRGRIAYIHMVNPRRGARLRRIFESIRWEEAPA